MTHPGESLAHAWTGREVLGTAKVHLWVEGKKRWGKCHSEFVVEKPAGSTYMISMNFLAPSGKKKTPLLSQIRSLLWFRCIYTSICLKLFFSCLHSVPCSSSVSWNSSASMSRCVWWCSRVRWKECSVQVSSKGSADYSQKMWWLLGLCADQITQKSSWKWVLRKIKINLSKGYRGAPSSVLQPKCPRSNFHGPYLTGVLYFKTF